MKINIVLNRDGISETRAVEVSPPSGSNQMTILDGLLALQDDIPDLAFRYGCRNELCGICSVRVKGRSRLACKTPLREGMTIEPQAGLPVLQDLVVRRDGVNRQLAGRLPVPAADVGTLAEDHGAYDALGRCIECYACLDTCPLHNSNDLTKVPEGGYSKGNPYSFLKIRRAELNPGATDADRARATSLAKDLDIDVCKSCDGCTCGIGINLVKDVIRPLLNRETDT